MIKMKVDLQGKQNNHHRKTLMNKQNDLTSTDLDVMTQEPARSSRGRVVKEPIRYQDFSTYTRYNINTVIVAFLGGVVLYLDMYTCA